MPERKTKERVSRDRREGKSASTQAGEFVREEMDHIREGKHGARSTRQAIWHRSFEGSPVGREAAGAEEGSVVRKDAPASGARSSQGKLSSP